MNNPNSRVKLRIVGQDGRKSYRIASAGKIKIYGGPGPVELSGPETGSVGTHFSADSVLTAFIHTNLYETSGLSPSMIANFDEGLLLGLQYKTSREGFRRLPYGRVHQFAAFHSIYNRTVKLSLNTAWLRIGPRTDFLLNANAYLPQGSFKYTGFGNETSLSSYSRFIYQSVQLDPQFRLHLDSSFSISAGPRFQYFKAISSPRLIDDPGEQFYAGLRLFAGLDTRKNKILPLNGVRAELGVQALKAADASRPAFLQLTSAFSFYVRFSPQIRLANRLGLLLTAGPAGIYHASFLGGQGNLLGYRRFRFAGLNSLAENLELRVKIADVKSYYLPGELGLTGLFDAGTVWTDYKRGQDIHTALGAGMYYAFFRKLLLNVQYARSEEGFYPYASVGFRF